VFDRDAKFGGDVFRFLKTSGLKPVRTSIRSLWQNGVAERWVGSCRREMLDHVIPLNKQHLRRLGRDYLTYCHEDRTHIGLEKETPARRPIESHATGQREPLSLPRIGGLHHTWSEAASPVKSLASENLRTQIDPRRGSIEQKSLLQSPRRGPSTAADGRCGRVSPFVTGTSVCGLSLDDQQRFPALIHRP
jgi:hypothetical protein